MIRLGGEPLGALMDQLEADSAETRDLLDQARGGNRAAFERLFQRHQAALLEFIDIRLDSGLRARVDASDVAQETQLETFRRLQGFLRCRPMPFRELGGSAR